MPLPSYTPCMRDDDQTESDLISDYFKQGYRNAEIVEFPKLHLKRRLGTLGLKRQQRMLVPYLIRI